MSKLYCMVTIADRSKVNDYLKVFDDHNVPLGLVTMGEGTAGTEIQELFGLQTVENEKAVCFSIIRETIWISVKKDLERRVRSDGRPFVNAPWSGVSFIVPLSSVGGPREMAYLTRGMDFKKGAESELKNTIYELIIVICNIGYNDMVMDAARDAGASGGTIIHARGTQRKETEDFLGISLATERDMVFIVSTAEEKDQIMESIMKNAGIDTKAGGLCFSLPVTATAGFKITKERAMKKQDQE